MITSEKRRWLRINKRRGDIEVAVDKVNEKLPEGEKKLSHSMARNILSSQEHFGRHGPAFTKALEKIIKDRAAAQERERIKYATPTD